MHHRKVRSLPSTFEISNAPTGSGVPSGIIAKIRSEVSDIISYVEPTSNSGYSSDLDTIVNWSYRIQHCTTSAFLQVEFKKGYVFPTNYSIKGYNWDACFAKEWYLYGLTQSNGEKTLLSTDSNSGTTYCSTNTGCRNDNWATFSINSAKKAFRFFRMETKTRSCSWSSNDCLLLGGFDVFGVYSFDGRTSLKKNKRQITCFASFRFSFYSIIRFTIYVCN